MKNNFTVALIGRPNVGKSTLFNRLIRQKISVVSPISGVTRDRIYEKCQWNNNSFWLIDTGGINFQKQTSIHEQILIQTEIAISEADLICFLVDNKVSPTDDDILICNKLLKLKKNAILIINKADSLVNFNYEYEKLPLKEKFYISSEHGNNVGDVLNYIVSSISAKSIENSSKIINFSFIGLTNAGKSSLANALLNQKRFIVSKERNTTRDAVSCIFNYNDIFLKLIDTPGIKYQNKIIENLLFYSYLRSFKAIANSDVLLFVIDSTEKLSKQLKKIAQKIEDQRKIAIILLNKSDLKSDSRNVIKNMNNFLDELKSLKWIEIIKTSALNNKNIDKLLPTIYDLVQKAKTHIPTPKLNTFINELQFLHKFPSKKGKTLKIYYISQNKKAFIPSFILYVNDIGLVSEQFKKFLYNKMYKIFKLKGVPINIKFKTK